MSDEETASAVYERGVKFGTQALHAAMREDWDGVKTALAALNGSEALIVAIMAWCDTLLQQHPDGPHSGDRPVAVAWLGDGKGRIQHAEDVSPPVRWAGQVVAARAALDPDAFYALLDAPADGADLGACVYALLDAPADGADLGACVCALVQSVAMTLGASTSG